MMLKGCPNVVASLADAMGWGADARGVGASLADARGVGP